MIRRQANPLARRAVSRRAFNRGALAVAGGAILGAPAFLRGQNLNSKLNIAMIASGGRASAHLSALRGENIVSLCDVNAKNVADAAAQFPEAKRVSDFRKLFDRPEDFDAVVVSTCEHTHAIATMAALRANKHVYCEKPLTHDVYEARKIREAAAGGKVVTQMGIQMHATDNYRRIVEIIWSGAIGPVTEAHVWVSRAWGLQSEEAAKRNKDIVYVTERPREAMQPPPYLNWDLWLGPAPERPFHEVYFPGPRWYRWWDFGNGTMSDLGSHWNDLPFWALKLKAPLTIEASTENRHPEIAPASMTAKYEYAARGAGMPACTLTWYQGEHKPERWKAKEIPQWSDGVLFVGEKGMLLADYGKYRLLPEKDFADYKPPEPTLPRVKGHQKEWVDACKGGPPTLANFEYAGWLTEANHLGNVAFRVGRKLQWDAEHMRATNAPDADQFLRRPYRQGWAL
jgi:predicted dehydrogenase